MSTEGTNITTDLTELEALKLKYIVLEGICKGSRETLTVDQGYVT